jgi:hypothetical protein
LVLRYVEGRSLKPQMLVSELAHEIAHSASVWHHGEKDLQFVQWQDSGDTETVLEYSPLSTRPAHVYVFDEANGQMLDPTNYPTKTPMYVSWPQGQHSGDESCLMRYHVSEAYRPPDKPSNVRVIYTDTDVGTKLCKTYAGSAAFKNRYDQADIEHERGNCYYQLCVNDLYIDDEKHNRAADK